MDQANASLLGSSPKQSELDDAINGPNASAGTTAIIGEFADVTAGHDIEVKANEKVSIEFNVGGFAAGLAGVGAAVGVYTLATNAKAESGGNLTAGSLVDVTAVLDQDVKTISLAGGAGFVGLGAAVVDVFDSSKVQAAVGTVKSAQSVNVLADADQVLSLGTGQLGFGGLAGGASFTRLESTGSVEAVVLGGAQIGKAPGLFVGSLNVNADSAIDADNTTTAVAFGALAVSTNFARANVSPKVYAGVGFGADIDIVGGATVDATAEHDAASKVLSLTGAGSGIHTAERVPNST